MSAQKLCVGTAMASLGLGTLVSRIHLQTGEIEAVVIATGVHTFFGKAAHLVDSTNQVGHFQKVFARGVDGEAVVLMAARASRVENQDAIDAAIVVGTLADPKEARVGIQEVHFLPFNPTDKRTVLTFIDSEGKMHRVSKGITVCCAICRICYYSK